MPAYIQIFSTVEIQALYTPVPEEAGKIVEANIKSHTAEVTILACHKDVEIKPSVATVDNEKPLADCTVRPSVVEAKKYGD